MPRLCLSLLLSLLIASSASAVTMDWTPVGNPGNACEVQPDLNYACYGGVAFAYNIGTYEVTNAQYVAFLNAKAASDPLGLYNSGMGSGLGGITRSGVSGSYNYSTRAGRGDLPVNYVSYFDALRFANWMNNGQGSGNTETGAYTLVGGTANPFNGETVKRNLGATIVLASEDEWYKAAYYDAVTTSYFDYPAGSDTQTTCSTPTATANRANCGNAIGDFRVGGSYTGSASPYGTFDQGGNVWEWNESKESSCCSSYRVFRGGAYDGGAYQLAASSLNFNNATLEHSGVGFRLAYIPEPGTGLLVIAGLLGLAGWRRGRA